MGRVDLSSVTDPRLVVFRSICPSVHLMPTTDYIRHAARLARKLHMDAAMGGTPQPDPEFYKTLAKALEEIAAGLEQAAKRE